MNLDSMLRGAKVIAVVCNQYGDSGKGKFSDFFAEKWADVTARGTGGNNAGHTVEYNNKKIVFHLVPAGITQDANGKITVLGNGMVLDLPALTGELDELTGMGLSYNNLRISKDAQITLPFHVARDISRNRQLAEGGIGSTGRGIGPTYTDKISRPGLTIEDMFDRERAIKIISKMKLNYPEYAAMDAGEIYDSLRQNFERVTPYVKDTVNEMHRFLREGKKILIEGAQGLLLSIEHGVRGYSTSSDCSLNGTASGVGLSAKMVDIPFGIVKFPYQTKVGGGPFTTELGGLESETYCSDGHSAVDECKLFGIDYEIKYGKANYNIRDKKIINLINSKDLFMNGVGIRLAGNEFGATTGRPRRVGWSDAVATKYATGINGGVFIYTKPDCLSGIDDFDLCFDYTSVEGESVPFTRNAETLKKVSPVYKKYSGFGDISEVREYGELPESLRNAIADFEKYTGGFGKIVSVGPDREQTIIRG